MIELLFLFLLFGAVAVVMALPEAVGFYLMDHDKRRAADACAEATEAKRQRKEKIWQDMQRAKQTGAAYQLPDDWND